MNDTILINRLPTRTWNRLGVNETALTWGQADDLGEEKITAAGQTERLEITGSGERGEKMVDIHVPAGQTVTVFETLRAEKGLLVRTALHVEKDAKVRLVQIQNAAQGSLLRLETSGECAENELPDCGDYESYEDFMDDWDGYMPDGSDAEDYWEDW